MVDYTFHGIAAHAAGSPDKGHSALDGVEAMNPKREILKELTEWVGQAAEGAAKGTQTTVTSEIISGFYERLHNVNLAELVQGKLELVGGIEI